MLIAPTGSPRTAHHEPWVPSCSRDRALSSFWSTGARDAAPHGCCSVQCRLVPPRRAAQGLIQGEISSLLPLSLPSQGGQGRICNPSSLHTPCPSCNTPVKPCLQRLSNLLAGAFGCSCASRALCHPINFSALTPVKHRQAAKRDSEILPWARQPPLLRVPEVLADVQTPHGRFPPLTASVGSPEGAGGAGWPLGARWCGLEARLSFLLSSLAQPEGNTCSFWGIFIPLMAVQGDLCCGLCRHGVCPATGTRARVRCSPQPHSEGGPGSNQHPRGWAGAPPAAPAPARLLPFCSSSPSQHGPKRACV